MTTVPGGDLRAPSRRSTYGLLVGVGAAILVVGLLLPFLVADPVNDQALTSGGGSTSGSLEGGTGEPGGPGVPGGVTTDGIVTTIAPAIGAPAGPGAGPIGGGTVTRTASDVGITANTVVVGIPVPDTSAMGDTEGGVQFGETLGDFRVQYGAAIEELNERGGIGGRRVVAEYRSYAAGDPDAMRAACLHLTEEKKVFAVLAGFFGDPILCVTEQHETPMIAQASEPDDYYARSSGRYFSITASKDRILGDLAASLHRDGLLRGKTIGVLDQEGVDAIPVDRTLLPTLDRLGYDVAYHARIANDTGAAQSQIPLEVQRMRGAGVDTVIIASGLIRATVFVQEAQNQRWKPQYLLSDFASGATDVYTLAMSDSFDGALAYTSFRTGEAKTGRPEADHDRACREIYERRSGDTLDRAKIEYFYAVTACGIVGLFERGFGGAGPNPTRATFSQALQAIGQFAVPYGSTGSFAPGKFDAPDTTRRVGWRLSCKCWLPIDDFQPTGA
jgi:ABC-type branched-subunit amino acid transport system substrate-binding protein